MRTKSPWMVIEMSEYILETKKLCCRMGKRYLLKDVTWQVKRGEHWIVYGMNGSGKTTLLSIAAGFKLSLIHIFTLAMLAPSFPLSFHYDFIISEISAAEYTFFHIPIKFFISCRQTTPTHPRFYPVSYTHLDVYKRQALGDAHA